MIKTAKRLLSLMGERERRRVILSVILTLIDFIPFGVPLIVALNMVVEIIKRTLI